MKTKTTLLGLVMGLSLQAQTITYSNFSAALSSSLNAVIGNPNSFNASLITTVGNGVTWNAAALTQQSGTPTLSIIYGNPSNTPYASTFPNSNYVIYDPALITVFTYDYLNFSADSVVRVGQYEPNLAHEIYTNPDKSLIFPFALNQSFTDNYAKTNYSDATTISSFQTGARTVSYIGYGTLTLPQGTFSNVALVSEMRTNSLGPDAHTYIWYEVNTGKKLLMYGENNGSINVIFNTDLNTGVESKAAKDNTNLYPNPAHNQLFLLEQTQITQATIYNTIGQSFNSEVSNNSIDVSGLPNGLYFIEYLGAEKTIKNRTFIKE